VNAACAVFAAWLLFGGTHLLLSWPPVRRLLGARIGEATFTAIYALIAATSLLLLAIVIARYGAEGPRGFDLASYPIAKWSLGAVAFIGAALAAAGIANFPRSAIAVLSRKLRPSNRTKHEVPLLPSAIERVTRHPFFVGLVLLMVAHTLLASTLPAALFFAGFVLLALLGLPMQERKLRERHGELYGSFADATSAIPFVTAKDRSRGGWRQVSAAYLPAIAGGILVALLHPLWSHKNGAWFAVLVAGGGLYATARQVRRKHK